ncbi:nucleotidyltransferase family protein [Paenibacillus sp. BC26]|uniref:nucleotidyltransferase family protein n=1 Tax=Paenibacillus sp. BC26 TaxID=1881032 RepID=UPI0008E0365A|nr:nucleotidyltransferase family protein [Paenibacillus sp. BC26]SFS70978.1 hypothetical protein SAMN05428962_2410 [Paenibacillus sp. BC26]
MAEKSYFAQNQDIVSQVDSLIRIVQMNPVLQQVLGKSQSLQLEHYYVGAGCVTQTVWNYLCGRPLNEGIKDLDFVYYDEDLSYDKEGEIIDRVKALFGELPYELDVKNQARVHLWYEQAFGYSIQPYGSLEAAVNHWPSTATALGLRRDADGTWKVYAPFGLNDLFGLIVRANKAQITEPFYEQKAAKWKAKWPELKIIPWHE